MWREVKRRRLFKALASYGVVAWLLIQITVAVKAPLGLPSWSDTLVIVSTILGFPVCAVLAWFYDFTLGGIERTDDDGAASLRQPEPFSRSDQRMIALAGVAVAVVALAAAGWFLSTPRPPASRQPVSVLIADLRNETGDQVFDRTLEPLLRIVLESADFINAYDRSQMTRFLDVPPPETLDEVAAREIAVKQGLGVVLSGSLKEHGDGYEVIVRAVQAVTGVAITTVHGRAPDKEGVLAAATSAVTQVREALGDDRSDSAQRFALETLSATSLEVVHEYAAAMEAASNGKFADALGSFSKALELDPHFGLAHAGAAMMLSNLGREQEAQTYITEALRHIDNMTDRERYRTRGLFYVIGGDYQACVREYTQLIARYASDVAARNNLALCAAGLGDATRAVEEMRRAVEILPKRALYRVNLALYAADAGDFRTAEQEGRTAQQLGNPLGLLPVALAQVALGRLTEATATYEALGGFDPPAASFASSGLADIALYQGRFSHAVRILEQGAAEDLRNDVRARAALKLTTLAYVHLQRKDRAAAVAAAEQALTLDQGARIRFLAARVLVKTGQLDQAETLAESLRSELDVQARAYTKSLEGEIALQTGDPRRAITAFSDAISLVDSWWFAHFDLGRAYLEAGAFTQADSQFEWCIQNRGRILARSNEPSYGRFPPVFYYQGHARRGLNSSGFDGSYRTYLGIRGAAGEDPILPEVRWLIGRPSE